MSPFRHRVATGQPREPLTGVFPAPVFYQGILGPGSPASQRRVDSASWRGERGYTGDSHLSFITLPKPAQPAIARAAAHGPALRAPSDPRIDTSQARIDRPVDKRRASHPLPFPRFLHNGASRVRFHAGQFSASFDCGPTLVANPEHLEFLKQGVEAGTHGGSEEPVLQISAARTSAARTSTCYLSGAPCEADLTGRTLALGNANLRQGGPRRGGPSRNANLKRADAQLREPQRGDLCERCRTSSRRTSWRRTSACERRRGPHGRTSAEPTSAGRTSRGPSCWRRISLALI